ncbi:MAG: formate dehydrogenase subunit alpha [Chloroflexi bacterium]|nr:formate dehydrogenase subunit alpha [Chloroflexota bacterium]MCL5273979.1 formate dehydrogenase subunit alpha [Chloroflexota bacterium]
MPTLIPEMVNVTIDGRPYQAAAGTTLMEVARRDGLPVASVCYSDHLQSYGSCRLCVVQVQGQRALAAACTTLVRDGMVVATETPDIRRIRRTLLELYLSEDSHSRDAVGGRDHADMHTLAERYGADPARFEGGRHARRAGAEDASSPYFSFDPSRCILCARCVRTCDEIQGQNVLHLTGRGFHTNVLPGVGTFQNSACVTCGACVKECPTGALSDKIALTDRLREPTHTTRTTCAYCGAGCQFDVEVTDAGHQITRMIPVDSSPVNAGHACVKGRYAFEYIYAHDRLTKPLIRDEHTPDSWREASWEEAVALIAKRFGEIIARKGPDAVGCISSSRGTNEENYLMQKFARACLGTNNIDNCARVCHSATVAGMQEVIGTGAATNSLADIEKARLILIAGCNPTEGHPVTGARIKRAVRNGTKLVVIDPRKIELTRYADVHLQLRPGTNLAVFNGLAHVIIAEKLVDYEFVDKRTENFDAYWETVAQYTPERVEEISGVPADLLRKAARMYATSGASMAFHGLGVTSHLTGSYGVMALADLAILTGNIGRPGTGINPLRGQNNVQGSCDVGALPNVLTAYQKPGDTAVRARYEALWGHPLPQTVGLRIPDMWEAAQAGRLKAMWIMGYDAAQTEPNTELVRRAIGSLEFLVVSELFMSETARLAHVILPAASALEKDGTFTNGERRIQRVRRVVDPPGDARPDWEAISAVSGAMGVPMIYRDPSAIMDEIAQLTPPMAGISYARLDNEELQWPVPDAGHHGTTVLHTDQFPRGRAKFAPVEYLPPGEEPDSEYPFVLVTGRVLQHYNAGTMTRRTRLAQVIDHDALEIHPEDALACNLADGDLAKVSSRRGTITMAVCVSERVNRGTVFTSFHFPETRINSLMSSSSDVLTRCPEYKMLTVHIEPLEQQAR